MIRRIILHNFMAHQDTILEPADGITVLAGPNNCGKSAVAEALQVLAANSGKDFMTRHGTNDCRITVETSEGHCIQWRRKSNTVSYILNGVAVHRVRGGVPDDLHRLLRLPEVAGPDGQETVAVHFGTQKEPIFLLDRSGRHTATFFASSSDAGRLVAMQAAHKKRVADHRAEERLLAKQELQLVRNLECLQPVADLLLALEALEATHAGLQAQAVAIHAQEDALQALNRQASTVVQALDKVAILRDLPAPPVLIDTAPLEQLRERIRATETAVAYETRRRSAIQPLAVPPILEETRELENMCLRLARKQRDLESQTATGAALSPLVGPPALEPLAQICHRLESQSRQIAYLHARAEAVACVPAPPAPFDVDALWEVVRSLRVATATVKALEERALALAHTPAPMELADPGPMVAAVSALREAQSRVQTAADDLQQADAQLHETASLIHEWAKTNPLCPTCGAAIDPDRILSGGDIRMPEFRGILFIGDPHLASHVPGFRKDNYPATILAKVTWCLDYAREHALLPAFLGDLFHQPRDNANWLLGELLAILGRQQVIGIFGNHDCRQDQLDDNDSLAVIVKSGLLRLVEESRPWRGTMGGRSIVIGGTSWGRRIPRSFQADPIDSTRPLVFWMAHHDVKVPGYEDEGQFRPFEIEGVDVVVNGHIHRRLSDVQVGRTLWITPGNIVRIKRSELSRAHVPAALQITFSGGSWQRAMVTIPHQPFADVFHPELQTGEEAATTESLFVQGLAELQTRRTASGAGLKQFIELNQESLEPDVRTEIWKLFKEVETHEQADSQAAV